MGKLLRIEIEEVQHEIRNMVTLSLADDQRRKQLCIDKRMERGAYLVIHLCDGGCGECDGVGVGGRTGRGGELGMESILRERIVGEAKPILVVERANSCSQWG